MTPTTVTTRKAAPAKRLPRTPDGKIDASARKPTLTELESSLEAYFYKQVRLVLGGKVFKLAPTEKGLPDRLVLLPGGIKDLVELKAVTGRTSAAQDLMFSRMAELGSHVYVLTGREQVDRWIAAKAQYYTRHIKR